ncbi:MAG: peptide chain release factor N(5)-glutamine methyltransferase [Caldiserica bacterium]|nr:peptide chain release factor N(5)-glutamine methyltransferase [Caldisericota bacterium]MDH7562093.1 peptide chain release factor N(5)-glutamine methyltransferase [Caldisericota bacterium]
MKLKEALKFAIEELKDPREATYLLSEFLRSDLSRLYRRPDEELEGSPGELFRWIELRKKGVPLAYLSHRKEFFGRTFYIDRRVLIPRPETELLIEEALNSVEGIWGKDNEGEGLSFLDLGTGSGVIGITLALELPRARILASDISPDALEVARKNARRFGVEGRVSLIQGDLFSPLSEPVDGILANLPYVGEGWVRENPELSFEPKGSLVGGKEGMETVLRMLGEAPWWLKTPGFLIAEIGAGEEKILEKAGQAFPRTRISLIPDLHGLPRLVKIEIKNGDSPHF